jgi:hypothetical protein
MTEKMKMERYILTMFILQSVIAQGQTFEKKFTGEWDKTFWTFEFHKDGSYKRTSTGRLGDSTYTGKFKIYNDTIEILDGYQNSNGTLNKYYLIDDNYHQYGTRPKGRIIDLTNLYEYYEKYNDAFYPSHFNKKLNITILDSVNKKIKSFTTYLPTQNYTYKAILTLGFCIHFFDYPGNLKKADLLMPPVKYPKNPILIDKMYDNKARLVYYPYTGDMISGIHPYYMTLEYLGDTEEPTKITDSKDNSFYNFKYNNEGSIIQIEHLTKNNKPISKLIISE